MASVSLAPGSTGGPPNPDFNDIYGFRQGLVDPGEDVGLWTSIAVSKDLPLVAYREPAAERVTERAS